MTKAPTDGTLGPKEVDDKEYWWCEALERWCRHKPSECNAGDRKKSGKPKTAKDPDKENSNPSKSSKTTKSALSGNPRWSTSAVQGLIDGDSDSDS